LVGGARRASGVPHFESKRRIEERIAGFDVPVTVLRPAMLIENSAGMDSAWNNGELTLTLVLAPDAPADDRDR